MRNPTVLGKVVSEGNSREKIDSGSVNFGSGAGTVG